MLLGCGCKIYAGTQHRLNRMVTVRAAGAKKRSTKYGKGGNKNKGLHDERKNHDEIKYVLSLVPNQIFIGGKRR